MAEQYRTGTPNTLTEPISTTIMSDVRRVGRKLKTVMWPRGGDKAGILRDWDLWGPLILCLILATILSLRAPDAQKAIAFTVVFVIVWVGGVVVTLNSSLLGGTISLLQSVCVLGYCIAPLCLASILCLFWNAFLYRAIVVMAAFGWSTFASTGFLAEAVPEKRRLLAVYPIFLFYLTISWMVLTVS